MERSPDRIAVRQGSESVSYAELNRRANRLAHALLQQSAEPGERVAVLPRDPLQHAVAQLGVLKAKKVVVPIDPSFPLHRRMQIVTDAGVRTMIATAAQLEPTEWWSGKCHGVLAVDGLDEGLPSDNPPGEDDGDAMAFILYTSGSTGVPKGIVQNHRNLLRVATLYHRDLGIGPDDRVTTPTAPAYTGTIWALLATLTNGATFVSTTLESATSFTDILARERITVVQLIVSLLRQLTRALECPLTLPDLRLVYTGGEYLHRGDVARIAARFPTTCRLLYNYGSTEAGMICHHLVDLGMAQSAIFSRDATPFSVGHPVEGVHLRIVDDGGNPLPAGAPGEIAVASQYLSPGYWNDPERTRKQLLPASGDGRVPLLLTGDVGRLAPDGSLTHLGRKDAQVKVRGFRINLSEIEQPLRAIDGVAAVVTRVTSDANGTTRIVAYLVWENSIAPLPPDEVRRRLGAIVPDYMVPARLIYLDRLPVADSGKLNNRLLPDPDGTRPELGVPFLQPRNEVESILCRMWSEVLHIQPVGVRDHFLDLGGDSLSALRLIAQANARWRCSITVATVLRCATIEQLAEEIESVRRESQASSGLI